MKSKLSLISAFCLIALCGLLTSCGSNGSEIYEKIPADAMLVAKVNIKSCAEQSGIEFGSDAVVFPSYLEEMLSKSDENIPATLFQINEAIDLREVVFTMIDKNNVCAVAKIIDKNKLEKVLADENIEKETYNNYTVYPSASLVIDGDYVWTVAGVNTPSQLVDPLTKMFEAAKKAPLSKVEVAMQALNSDVPLSATVNVESYVNALGAGKVQENLVGTFATIQVKTVDNSLETNYALVKADGSPVDFPTSGEINSSLLNYVPEDFSIIYAAGTPAEGSFDGAINTLGMIPDYRIKSIIPVIKPYLEAIDGSMMMAAGADMSFYTEPNLNNWNVLLMVHMDQATVNGAVSDLVETAANFGLTPVERSEGLYTVSLEGREIYFGNVDGYLTVSTVEPNDNHTNPLCKYLVGHTSGLALEAPVLNTINPGLPTFAPRLTMQAEPDLTGKTVITLLGSDDNFVTAILKAVAHSQAI